MRLLSGTTIICQRDKKRCEPITYPFTKVVGKPPFPNKQLTPNGMSIASFWDMDSSVTIIVFRVLIETSYISGERE